MAGGAAAGAVPSILGYYAQLVEAKDEKTGRKKRTQIRPRYHEFDVVRRLLVAAGADGVGRRYLIQHSAGSGTSNSFSWLASQLTGLTRDDAPVFDSMIGVTDRRILDRQLRHTIRQYAQVSATVGHADRSGDLRRFIESGKKIIISTVQQFPFILDEIGKEQRGRSFAIIIDDAHSSQGGRTSLAMVQALSAAGAVDEEKTCEDQINRLMESRSCCSTPATSRLQPRPRKDAGGIWRPGAAAGPRGQASRLSQLHREVGDPSLTPACPPCRPVGRHAQ